MQTTYDFNVHIRSGDKGYAVTAQGPGTGLAGPELLDWGMLISEASVELFRRLAEEAFALSHRDLKQAGDLLFRSLFRGQIERLFTGFYDRVVQMEANSSLRIRLDIEESLKEVVSMPWELMCWRDSFLSTQITTMITRQILNLDFGNVKTLTTDDKPRVLVAIPQGSGLNTDEEENAIASSLEKTGIEYDILKGIVTIGIVDDTLANRDYHIFHFIGHATNENGIGLLRFNQHEEGGDVWIDQARLQSLFGNHRSIRLIYLNSSDTSIGISLLRAGIPAVIVTQFIMRDDTAKTVADIFYKRLCSDKYFGRIDLALTLARNACHLAYVDDRDFAAPVLFMNSHDSVIFKQERSTSGK